MIKGKLNTEWVKDMLKKHGPLTMPELRKLRAGPEGDGQAKSVSCALDELFKSGEVVRRAGNQWGLATTLGWNGIFASITPAAE